jgi:alpha-L-rhamnosidase
VNALVNDIKKRNNALTAGDIGFRYVLKALESAGESELIYAMNSKDDVPGYGFQLKHGATALTESWQAYESVSNNHFMLGHLMEWFYSGLAGICQQPGSTAYQQLEFKPQPVGDIRYVNASFQTMYGEVKSSWTKEDGVFTLEILVPANTRATVFMPGSKKPILTGSGTYTFKSKI